MDRHEDEFISLILQTYGEHGIAVSRAQFVNAYVLGTVQMFVWSGGGLQMLLGDLHGRGLFDTLVPDDQRCKHPDSDLDPDTAYVNCSSRLLGLCCVLDSVNYRHNGRRQHAAVWQLVGFRGVSWLCAGTFAASFREKMVAAEMTRRTFTNVCNIMARHDFVGAWEIWKQQQKKSA